MSPSVIYISLVLLLAIGGLGYLVRVLCHRP